MISLLHPSRGRPQKAHETAKKWIEKAGQDVEYILSIDIDDPCNDQYRDVYMIVENNNKSVVEATNTAAKSATGDILLYLSDDFDCPDNWANLITEKVKDFGDTWLLKVDDCLQQFHVQVLTIPIMSRGLYEKLGYFWHPEYKSMFVDEDLYWTCKNNGWLKFAPELKFPHNHVSIGKAQDDETYRRSSANWDQGKATFQRRKSFNFPL